MDIHANAKKRLIEAIAEALPGLQIDNGRFVRRVPALIALQAAEAVLPATGKLRDSISAYIEYDFAISEFVIDSLSDELRSQEYSADQLNQKLTEIAGYENSKQVAKRLVESLAALPRKYTLSVKLPIEPKGVIASDRWKEEFSPYIRIARGGADLRELYPVEAARPFSGLLNAIMGSSMTWEENALYLQIEASGFIGIYGGSTPHQESIRIVRSFCGLGLALRLFDTKTEYSFQPSQRRLTMYVHEMVDGDWKPSHTLDLSDSLSASVGSLRLHDVDGWITDEFRQISWARAKFAEMRVAFEQGKKPESLQLAAQWFFDGSRDGADELLRYVQMMIVLEILLGDKNASDQTGLNELLRNRCAYLIGGSNEQRNELLDLFSKIYAVRSQIVHRGKHRLSMDERGLFRRLKWMCRRVIAKEIELLVADRKGA